MQTPLETLHAIRAATGAARVPGLTDETVAAFLERDPDLATAIEWAAESFEEIRAERPELVAMDEEEALSSLQAGFVNFYSPDAVNPFVALAAKGPWVVTLHGAVVHDSGGYGMLGFGHEPEPVREALTKRQVMANIMTGNVAQTRFLEALRRELGHAREDGCPFDRFLCMNSGSEAMSVAARISDARAKRLTDEGGAHAGKRCVYLAIERGFHGRTHRPASFSDSTRPKYERFLASFRDLDNLWLVPSNDVDALRSAFERAASENVFIESVILEPVQGEGSPGVGVTRAFYDEARRLTIENDGLLIVDSIQAGLRAWGTLSIVDYPGFEDAAAPDIESWSKAMNAGQFPLSVLGLTDRAASEYQVGIYGNTMTTNPRGLDIACAVLGMVTPEVRQNIREQGCKFVGDLQELQKEFPDLVTEVHGTGLLFCSELNPERVGAIGPGSAEERCRMRGVAIIHGGKNALRFTPHFRITDAERELLIGTLRAVLAEIHAELAQPVG
jgi:acetylornithine/succinyldiaminopimelate/putrescine aminotransferase